MALNLFKNTVALVVLAPLVWIVDGGLHLERAGEDWLRLVVSGLFGLSLADSLLFAALRRIGAARVAVVDTVYAPLVVLLAWGVLGEPLGPGFLAGAGLVLGGVAMATIEPGVLSRRDEDGASLLGGMVLGACAISGTAIGVTLAKPALASGGLLEVTWIRLVAGVGGQLLYLTVTNTWAEVAPIFRPQPLWRTLLPATLFGTILSLVLWLGGFKWAPASTAAVLNQMATVYILVLARVFLGERLRPARVLGGLVAAAGALTIVLGRLGC